jgi:hypothetical protein
MKDNHTEGDNRHLPSPYPPEKAESDVHDQQYKKPVEPERSKYNFHCPLITEKCHSNNTADKNNNQQCHRELYG